MLNDFSPLTCGKPSAWCARSRDPMRSYFPIVAWMAASRSLRRPTTAKSCSPNFNLIPNRKPRCKRRAADAPAVSAAAYELVATVPAQDPLLAQVRDELKTLRAYLETQMAEGAWNNLS